MARATVATQLIESHLVSGRVEPGDEVGLHMDHTLTQDATGTLVMLELEAMGLDEVQTEVSAQYVDHNLLQLDDKNPDDHLFLRSAAERFGLWFARPGSGISHVLHMAKLGRPGRTMVGSDSHTCSAGALGMLAIGAGGIEVAMAMQGEPLYLPCPRVWGVRLEGELPAWVGAKDVILEMLREHGTAGAVGSILEYHGPGVGSLTAMDRHVIANMGAELGATTSVFSSDDRTRAFLARHGRADDYIELRADDDATWDRETVIDLAALEPLIARPQSPGNVVPVREVEGEPIYQSYIGSSANPGFRDFAVAARLLEGRTVPPEVSLDVNPSSREVLDNLARTGHLSTLLAAGARLHQPGCNGCIGMGQAPAYGKNSLRTVPRNFPGRSGTREDSVWLCSPETAAASALEGCIQDPREVASKLGVAPFHLDEPADWRIDDGLLLPPRRRLHRELHRGPNIKPLPELSPPPDELELPVLLVVGDDVSTDEILPAGAEVLPFRSNLPRISEFCFRDVSPDYPDRVREHLQAGGHAIVAGDNYGQGSSREHAALAPRSLGLRLVVARSFSRIHRQNLVSFGVLPLTCEDTLLSDLQVSDVLCVRDVAEQLRADRKVRVTTGDGSELSCRHDLSPREVDILLQGGLMRYAQGGERRRATGDEPGESEPGDGESAVA